MRMPAINDSVRLSHDVPELELHRGDCGIIRSTWLAPALAFEVEFAVLDAQQQRRALLRMDQIELNEVDRGD